MAGGEDGGGLGVMLCIIFLALPFTIGLVAALDWFGWL